MKHYEMPELTVTAFTAQDIVTTSDSFEIPISPDPMGGSEAL